MSSHNMVGHWSILIERGRYILIKYIMDRIFNEGYRKTAKLNGLGIIPYSVSTLLTDFWDQSDINSQYL